MARLGAVVAGLALLAALAAPLLIGANRYFLDVLIMSFIWAIAACGLNVLLGYTGLLSLAHAAFFGVGAYGTGLLTLRLGWSFWLAWPAATLLAAALGALLGLVAYRARAATAFAIFHPGGRSDRDLGDRALGRPDRRARRPERRAAARKTSAQSPLKRRSRFITSPCWRWCSRCTSPPGWCAPRSGAPLWRCAATRTWRAPAASTSSRTSSAR